MVTPLLIGCLIITFLASLLLTPWWIKRSKKAGITGIDMHKLNKSNVSEIGGLPVLVSFILGVLLYLGIRTFYFQTTSFTMELLAAVLTVTLVGIIGFVDDILGWRIGLQQWQKPLLCIFASLPIMMINAGTSTLYVPLFGSVNFGILYPLLIIPLIIVATSNSFNMIAGYNGLETGMGILILFCLGTIIWQVQGMGIIAMLSAIMIASLLGFLFFNHYPSQIFPGDTLTYSVGALAGILAILGNIEKTLIILFFPYIVQFFVKAHHGWKKQSFSPISGKQIMQVKKPLQAIEHLPVMLLSPFIKVKEYHVVYSLFLIQSFFVILAFWIAFS